MDLEAERGRRRIVRPSEIEDQARQARRRSVRGDPGPDRSEARVQDRGVCASVVGEEEADPKGRQARQGVEEGPEPVRLVDAGRADEGSRDVGTGSKHSLGHVLRGFQSRGCQQRVTDLRDVVDCDGGGGVVEHPLDEAVRQGGRADDGSAVQDGACWRRKGSASLHHGQNISSVAQALVEVVGGRGEVSDDVYEGSGANVCSREPGTRSALAGARMPDMVAETAQVIAARDSAGEAEPASRKRPASGSEHGERHQRPDRIRSRAREQYKVLHD